MSFPAQSLISLMLQDTIRSSLDQATVFQGLVMHSAHKEQRTCLVNAVPRRITPFISSNVTSGTQNRDCLTMVMMCVEPSVETG